MEIVKDRAYYATMGLVDRLQRSIAPDALRHQFDKFVWVVLDKDRVSCNWQIK